MNVCVRDGTVDVDVCVEGRYCWGTGIAGIVEPVASCGETYAVSFSFWGGGDTTDKIGNFSVLGNFDFSNGEYGASVEFLSQHKNHR